MQLVCWSNYIGTDWPSSKLTEEEKGHTPSWEILMLRCIYFKYNVSKVMWTRLPYIFGTSTETIFVVKTAITVVQNHNDSKGWKSWFIQILYSISFTILRHFKMFLFSNIFFSCRSMYINFPKWKKVIIKCDKLENIKYDKRCFFCTRIFLEKKNYFNFIWFFNTFLLYFYQIWRVILSAFCTTSSWLGRLLFNANRI